MNTLHFTSEQGEHTVVIARIAERLWHALEDTQVVGRGEASPRPDGRLFLSVDAWHTPVAERLAQAMLADLPRPLFTVADASETDLVSLWTGAGLTVRRREGSYLIPTSPDATGLASERPPGGVRIVPAGAPREDLLREAYTAIRAEVDAAAGWDTVPAEIIARPDGTPLLDPLRFVAAAEGGRYVGLLRIAPLRQPRIGLVAVREDARRRGVARALLAHTLASLHRAGISHVSAEIDDANTAARALAEGIGAQRTGTILELVIR